MKYIVAFPDSLNTFDSLEDARALGDELRETKHVKIFEVREVEHWLPSGPKATPDPTPTPSPAGTPIVEALEKAA